MALLELDDPYDADRAALEQWRTEWLVAKALAYLDRPGETGR